MMHGKRKTELVSFKNQCQTIGLQWNKTSVRLISKAQLNFSIQNGNDYISFSHVEGQFT